ILAAVVGAALAVATAFAAVSSTVGAGTMAHSDLFGGPATVLMRTLTIAPGETLGWHAHPGVGAYTVVTQGTLVVEDGCGGETIYTAGQAFLEPPFRVHRGKNLTESTVVTAQTFIVPAGTPTSEPATRLCGAPLRVAECRSGGWMAFDYPRAFQSQGDCEQYVITGK
ncbi:MAG TPA: cupin domain-containing protein, partial [Gemmatimonadaceae bacterium]|nr:cupin domain-containing protein [Gemmatimonadaceae bacterium]